MYTLLRKTSRTRSLGRPRLRRFRAPPGPALTRDRRPRVYPNVCDVKRDVEYVSPLPPPPSPHPRADVLRSTGTRGTRGREWEKKTTRRHVFRPRAYGSQCRLDRDTCARALRVPVVPGPATARAKTHKGIAAAPATTVQITLLRRRGTGDRNCEIVPEPRTRVMPIGHGTFGDDFRDRPERVYYRYATATDRVTAVSR